MPPPISDLLRSRGGQTRTNNSTNNNNDVLPLHNNIHNNNNTNNTNNTNSNGTSVGRTASNVSTNNFLLGGMYVPNKDKRRQPKRRRVMGHNNNNNNNKWCKCSLVLIRQNVYIRYIFMIILLVMFGMIISQQQRLEEEDFFDLAHQKNMYRNLHRTYHQTNHIDRLLQDTRLIHQLPSMHEEKKRMARRAEDRYKYQQQRQQKHFKLLEMLIPEWYHRNDPIRIIETTTKIAAIVESKDKNDGVVISESRKKKLNHDTNMEQGITDPEGKSMLDNVIHIRPTSHRIRRTLQNNIHNMTQQLRVNESNGITKAVTITTSSCPRNLSPTNISVSLLVQSSIDRLWILQETCQRWKAPIIVVIAVLDGNHTTTASNNSSSTTVLQNHIVQWKQSCAQLQVIVYHLDSTTESTPESYPVNTLRNVALDAVSTSHILMMDIDFIPSQGLDTMIQSALIEQQQQHATTDANTTNNNEDNEKLAMVIPAFDRVLHPPCTSSDECAQHLRTNSNFIPFNFHELQQCYNNDECIIFQSMDNWEGHSSTRTELWLQQKWYADDSHDSTDQPPSSKRFRIIPCFNSLRYEPYVVIRWCPSSSLSQLATSNVNPVAPYYDERFHGYGKNKIQLISHLRLMGYKFTVLPNGGFIVHNPHVESSAKTVWNNIQEHQLHRTMDVLYQTFLNELVSIYLTGVQNGGTAPKNIVSACTTGHTTSKQ